MEIGHRIKKLRELRNLTQEHMAHELDITQQTYSRWEKGEIELTVTRLEQIAKVLKVRPEDIFIFDEKVAFNNNYCNFNDSSIGIGNNQAIIAELKMVYEAYIQSQQKEIEYLRNLLEPV